MIRQLKKEEIKKIAEYYEKEMFKEFGKIGEKPISKEEYEKRLKKSFNKDFMFVLEDDQIKGFIWFSKHKDEINLEEIFTIEKSKGCGWELIRFLIDFAKKEKIKRINLDVHFKNQRAISFFKKFYFSERTIEMSLDLN